MKKIRCGGCEVVIEYAGCSFCGECRKKNEIRFKELLKDKTKIIPIGAKTEKIESKYLLSLIDPSAKQKLKEKISKLLKRQDSNFSASRQNLIKKLIEATKQSGAAKKRRAFKQNKIADGFYETREWQKLRYKVLILYGRKCMCCGIKSGEFHVDHIKPRSLYPELQWEFNNLQVLCRDCNMGKSNLDQTDFR